MILLIEKYSLFLSNNQPLPLSLQFIKTSNYSSSPLLSPPISLPSLISPYLSPLSHLSLSLLPSLISPFSFLLLSPFLSSLLQTTCPCVPRHQRCISRRITCSLHAYKYTRFCPPHSSLCLSLCVSLSSSLSSSSSSRWLVGRRKLNQPKVCLTL